jgi:hypothetical protein
MQQGNLPMQKRKFTYATKKFTCATKKIYLCNKRFLGKKIKMLFPYYYIFSVIFLIMYLS